MKKLATIFAIAVITPSLVLAWLALSALRDQEIVVHSQRAILHQTATDSLAGDLNTFMNDVRLYFDGLVDELVTEKGADDLSATFNTDLKARWGQALVGCVITEQGEILSPQDDTTDPDAQNFLRYNKLFLSNQTRAEVYSTTSPVRDLIEVEAVSVSRKKIFKSGSIYNIAEKDVAPQVAASTSVPQLAKKTKAKKTRVKMDEKKSVDKFDVAVANSKLRSSVQSRRDFSEVNRSQTVQQISEAVAGNVEFGVNDLDDGAASEMKIQTANKRTLERIVNAPQKARTVSPNVQLGRSAFSPKQQQLNNAATNVLGDAINATSWSSLDVDTAGLREIMGDQPEGAIARFLQDGLHILLWNRHADAPGKIFWAELDLNKIRERLSEIVKSAAFLQKESEEVSLALLDAEGDIVAQTVPGFTTDWRHPFVASEVGEILPHWEVAAYWVDPDAVTRSAKTVRFTLWLLVPILLAAIGFGSILIFRDVNREMFLARQKTDFVSNVSHELKTPLTSIRMFSDLLSAAKTIETNKRTEYSGIISREAARLTRLINNLLDFSRMDRGDRKYEFEKLDAVALAKETVENYRMHIEADGCELEFRNENGESAWITGDRDALSQVLVNLLSNADKYACSGKEIILEIATPSTENVEIRVLDRGPGIRRKDAAKVFEKFFRADDSLATGIQGSGLGLTLAKQIAQGHGGDLNVRGRDGGGCCFTLMLPTYKT